MKKMSTGYGSTGQQVDMGNHWLLRIIAAIIDSIPWTIVIVIIFYAVFWSGNWWAWAPWLGWGTWLLLPLLMGILWVLYCTVLEASSSAATLGKRVMGLKVQMLDGSKVMFNKAFMRNISKIFWPILIIDWLIGVATPGPDPRQRYFDRIAGTTVVSVKQVFAPAAPPPPPPPA
jgi:uncharacterized RDD family membrane protein YckC